VPTERIVIVPPGYDDTRFFPVSSASREAIKSELGLRGPTVLALGRIAANKGYDLLIQAMPTVVERLPEARVLLAIGSTAPTDGERRQVEELRGLADRLGVGEQVTFGDHVPDEALADHYRAADCFALSSRYEPFGMTAVEAMACGTPAVITTSGGLWELVTWGVDALYADPTDPEAFGHALVTLLRDPLLAERIGQAAAERARAAFTWTGIARGLVDVIARVAETRDVGRAALDRPSSPVARLRLHPVGAPARTS
jgi:mannosylfructose-phosphate synthase